MRSNFGLYGSRCMQQLGNNLISQLKTRLHLWSMFFCTHQDWGKLSQLDFLGQTQISAPFGRPQYQFSISLFLLFYRFCALYIYRLCNRRNKGEEGVIILSFSPGPAQPSPATLVHKLCWMFMGNVLLPVAPNCLDSVLERCHH